MNRLFRYFFVFLLSICQYGIASGVPEYAHLDTLKLPQTPQYPYGIKGPQDTTDVTFFVISDTHIHLNHNNIFPQNDTVIKWMNDIPGTAYPDNIGGNVHIPRAVIVNGDLTDGATQEQYKEWQDLYGLNGNKMLHYPVLEGVGNHDGGTADPPLMHLRERNGKRYQKINVSSNGYNYSWDWGGIHFVQLNMYPEAKWDSTCTWCHYFNKDKKHGFQYPHQSLQFLEKDLKKRVGRSGEPVIIFHHAGINNDFINKVFWTKKAEDAYYQAIKPYNILAIFHGHDHAVHLHNTFHGIPEFSDGCTQHGTQGHADENGDFLVVHIIGNRMDVFARRNHKWVESNSVKIKKWKHFALMVNANVFNTKSIFFKSEQKDKCYEQKGKANKKIHSTFVENKG